MDIPNTQITEIIKNIWQIMFLSMAEPIEIEGNTHPFSITGSIHIQGAWNGSVFVHCSKDIISELSSQAFALDANLLTNNDIIDTMRELTNLIGGNIKPFLPSPSELAIAEVHFVNDSHIKKSQALLNRVDMMVNKGLLRVEVVNDDASLIPNNVRDLLM